MRLIEELRLEPFQGFWVRDVSDESRPAAKSVLQNLEAMREHYLDYVYALALRNYSDAQNEAAHAAWSKALEEARTSGDVFSIPMPDFVWRHWSDIGSSMACLALRNYVFALEPIQSTHGKVPEWGSKVDGAAIKAARLAFNERFPNIEMARHSVAHPEQYAKPGHPHGVKGDVETRDGQMIAEDCGQITLSRSRFGNNFAATFEGRVIEVEVSLEAGKFLKANVISVAQSLQEVFRL